MLLLQFCYSSSQKMTKLASDPYVESTVGAGSRFLGVSRDPGSARTDPWRAGFWLNGEWTSLGKFDSEEKAARAFDLRASLYGMPTNFARNDGKTSKAAEASQASCGWEISTTFQCLCHFDALSSLERVVQANQVALGVDPDHVAAPETIQLPQPSKKNKLAPVKTQLPATKSIQTECPRAAVPSSLASGELDVTFVRLPSGLHIDIKRQVSPKTTVRIEDLSIAPGFSGDREERSEGGHLCRCPAEAAGVRAGDEVIGVQGVSLAGLSFGSSVALLRSIAPGELVRLSLSRKTVSVTSLEVPLLSVAHPGPSLNPEFTVRKLGQLSKPQHPGIHGFESKEEHDSRVESTEGCQEPSEPSADIGASDIRDARAVPVRASRSNGESKTSSIETGQNEKKSSTSTRFLPTIEDQGDDEQSLAGALQSLVGRSVRKEFPGHGTFTGTVDTAEEVIKTRVSDGTSVDGSWIFRVHYLDGDEEDLFEQELRPILIETEVPLPGIESVVAKIQSKKPQNSSNVARKRSRLNFNASIDTHSMNSNFIGRMVAKDFPGQGTFTGKVASFAVPYYRIEYTDGDHEDVDESELRNILVDKN